MNKISQILSTRVGGRSTSASKCATRTQDVVPEKYAITDCASYMDTQKPIFYDMVHSNNAARIRIWVKKKGLEENIETKTVTYEDLETEEFIRLNPLKKVPALIDSAGTTMFESAVILNYLEDKYSKVAPSFTPFSPESRALVHLFCRIHDLYIASPNCTQPGFSHTQGAMYLSPYETKWCKKERCMDKATRAAKLAEIWKQLSWLEENLKGPYMVGEQLTIADMTWYPTCVYMEFMLPKVFDWPRIFSELDHFPKLTKWFSRLSADEAFNKTRTEIWEFWEGRENEGQFQSIKAEIMDPSFKWKYP